MNDFDPMPEPLTWRDRVVIGAAIVSGVVGVGLPLWLAVKISEWM